MEEVLDFFNVVFILLIAGGVLLIAVSIYDGIHKIMRDIYKRIEKRLTSKKENKKR